MFSNCFHLKFLPFVNKKKVAQCDAYLVALIQFPLFHTTPNKTKQNKNNKQTSIANNSFGSCKVLKNCASSREKME